MFNRAGIGIFQFHKGTIKPDNISIVCALPVYFQFHKGTIKPFGGEVSDTPTKSFNSIKVQLSPLLLITAKKLNRLSIP